ncbi:MAG: AMP-binding protein [Alcaligenaceae bacterium]|nr:AMP-binding protein [Alcaligenaceae bacterium]
MDKIWLSQYPKDVPEYIDLQQYQTALDIFETSCQKYADLPAFASFGDKITYKQVHEKAMQFATWLQNEGYQKGDRIGLMMPNLIQYPICVFGALKAGCIVVNCNPMYTASELTHQLNDAEVDLLIVIENFAHVIEQAQPELKTVKQFVITKLGDCLSPLKGATINFSAKYLKKLVPKWRLPNYSYFKLIMFKTDKLIKASKMSFTPVDINTEDIALLQYTGGTTGIAKGTILKHKNLVSGALQAHEWFKSGLNPNEQDYLLAPLPLYHIFAFSGSCLIFFMSGACSVLIANPRDMKSLIKPFKQYPISCMIGVNTLFNAITHYYRASEGDYSHLKLVFGGGMAIQKSVAERWQTLTETNIIQAYGLTETSPSVCANRLNSEFNGSIGLPVSSTEVSIRDANGQPCAIGEAGEICVRGPQVTEGYWKNPEESQTAFYDDGFFKTGDVGYMNEKGYVFLVDRIKEMIVVSGFNVYPSEVEKVANRHPNVMESAAIGVPNGAAGEVVKLFVVKRDPSIATTHREIVTFCRKALTGYKAPKIIEFIDTIPKNAVGKILRRELHEKAIKDEHII